LRRQEDALRGDQQFYLQHVTAITDESIETTHGIAPGHPTGGRNACSQPLPRQLLPFGTVTAAHANAKELAMNCTATTVRHVPDRTTLNILKALASGKTIAEAAARCNVSESTLRRKIAHLRLEWRVDSTIQAIVIAVRQGIV
jgi:DNA-binding CsgD family transcriptional regulator